MSEIPSRCLLSKCQQDGLSTSSLPRVLWCSHLSETKRPGLDRCKTAKAQQCTTFDFSLVFKQGKLHIRWEAYRCSHAAVTHHLAALP